jgi:aspartate/methionine/tyrosine aminotransferase
MSPEPSLDPRLAQRMDVVERFHAVDVMERAWQRERETGRPVISFGVGEPDFGSPSQVVEAATRAIASGQVRYTSTSGPIELREAIANSYAERFGVTIPASRIVVTIGASAALTLACIATVNPGDTVMMADPSYPANRNFVRAASGEPQLVPVESTTNYQLTRDHVAQQWTERTRGVLLASPANPTGTIIAEPELHAIADEVSARGGVLYADEIYGELVYDRAPSTLLAHTDDAFIINSFSKTFGMTGWRLGWMVCPQWALDAVQRLTDNLYLSLPYPSIKAGVAAFQPAVWAIVEERRQEFERRRDLLVAGLRDLGFGVPVVPQGAFYVYAECDSFTDDSFAFAYNMIEHAGVAATPGKDFGTHAGARHLRFSYTTSQANIEEGLARMAAYLR